MEVSAQVLPPGLRFIEAMTGYLAWPITIIILALLLRSRILELLGRLTGVEGPGFKIWIAEEASSARGDSEDRLREQVAERFEKPADPTREEHGKERARTRPEQSKPTNGNDSEEREKIPLTAYRAFFKAHALRATQARHLAIRPDAESLNVARATILECFTLIESAFRDFNALVDNASDTPTNIYALLSRVATQGIISTEIAGTILSLIKIRSAVVYSNESVSTQAARDYATSVANILTALDGPFDRALRRYL